MTTNAHFSQGKTPLYIFEDNEAVIKMIIKGRSPMMRHVSRTQRVELDRLFDRMNLDPKIHIKYVDTTNQLADLLTEGRFTRDEWCHLLCFVDVMDLSTISRSHFRSVEKATTMSKRTQERKKEEEPAVAKPRPVCLISTSLNRGQSSSFGLDVSNIPWNPQLDGKLKAGHCPKQSPKPRNVFSSVERRQQVSRGLRETATGHCPGRHA